MLNTTLPGINIRYPWSQLLLSGDKIVETRGYPLPRKYIEQPLAIIETPGDVKPRFKARVVGIIIFSHSIEYSSQEEWCADSNRHKVNTNDPLYRFKFGETKFGWVVKKVTILEFPCPAPAKRGIVFASKCLVPAKSVLTPITFLVVFLVSHIF